VATSIITIRELSGKKRQVDLIGGGLPFNWAEWGSRTKIDTTWNPGNPDGVQHVITPIELPSKWNGEWNSTRLIAAPCLFSQNGGSSRNVVFADELRDALEGIQREGQPLVVVWANEGRRVTRFGRMETTTFKHRSSNDIQWDINFEWTGRNTTTQKPNQQDDILAAARDANLKAATAAGYEAASRIISENADHPKSASTFTLGDLENMADAPRAFVSQFSRLAQAVSNRLGHLTNVIKTARDQPYAVANLVVAAASDAVSVANEFVDSISRKGPEQLSLSNDVRSLLRAASYYHGAQTQAEFMAASSARFQRMAALRRAQARPSASDPSTIGSANVIKTYLPKQGETMLSISLREYGEDLSFQLSRANGLPGQTITPPRIALILPQRVVLNQFN
jgi:hypothetical protein